MEEVWGGVIVVEERLYGKPGYEGRKSIRYSALSYYRIRFEIGVELY